MHPVLRAWHALLGRRAWRLLLVAALGCQESSSIPAGDAPGEAPERIERSLLHEHAFARTRSLRFATADGPLLEGRVHLPEGEPPHPAVVFVHGAGGSANARFYPPIWRVFLDAGFAVFSWDSPGLGSSQGNLWEQSFQDRADEVAAGIEALKRLDAIDGKRIGLWAISQGGWIAPLVAARRSDLRFMILVAAPAVPVSSQDLFQMEHRMRADGNPEDPIREALEFTKKVHALMLEGVSHQELAPLLEDVASRPWFEEYASHLADPNMYEFMRRNLGFDPTANLGRIRCPVLLIYGDLDMLVDGPESEAILRRELERAGNDEISVRYVENADHTLLASRSGGTRELMRRYREEGKLEYAPGYLSTMRDWLVAR